MNPRNPNDQPIQPPFPKIYVAAKDDAESIEDHIHHFGELDSEIYLRKEEHSIFSQEHGDKELEEEFGQYQKGYLHAIDDVQIKLKLSNKDVTVNKWRLD